MLPPLVTTLTLSLAGTSAWTGPLSASPPAPQESALAGDDWAEGGSESAEPETRAPWHTALQWLRDQREAFAGHLDETQRILKERAELEDPRLLTRLERKPPRDLATGYGLLPRIQPGKLPPKRKASQRTYSLESLPESFVSDFVNGALLEQRAQDGNLDLLVSELERLRTRQRRLDEHITYHDWWQRAVVDDADYFGERNEVVALARRWNRAVPGSVDQQSLGIEMRSRLSPFTPTPGLEILGR